MVQIASQQWSPKRPLSTGQAIDHRRVRLQAHAAFQTVDKDPGNLLAFSYNDATLADRSYTDALDVACLAPDIELVFEEHGPHLPAKDINATVYVLQRT